MEHKQFTVDALTFFEGKLWIINELLQWPSLWDAVSISGNNFTTVSGSFLAIVHLVCVNNFIIKHLSETKLKLQNNFSNYIIYYTFLQTCTSTQDLVRCDTLHIQQSYQCLEQSLTNVTVAHLLSRGPNSLQLTKSWTKISHTVTQTKTQGPTLFRN